jgi:intraflagellar transport protein 172
VQIVQLFETYGASANVQNFNLYKRLIDRMFATHGNINAYPAWASLRNMLLILVCVGSHERIYTHVQSRALADTPPPDERYTIAFNRYLLLAHYYALRASLATMRESQPTSIVAKLSVAVLRHTDLVIADRAFYEAGMACRQLPVGGCATLNNFGGL